jgi:hypothetical protein
VIETSNKYLHRSIPSQTSDKACNFKPATTEFPLKAFFLLRLFYAAIGARQAAARLSNSVGGEPLGLVKMQGCSSSLIRTSAGSSKLDCSRWAVRRKVTAPGKRGSLFAVWASRQQFRASALVAAERLRVPAEGSVQEDEFGCIPCVSWESCRSRDDDDIQLARLRKALYAEARPALLEQEADETSVPGDTEPSPSTADLKAPSILDKLRPSPRIRGIIMLNFLVVLVATNWALVKDTGETIPSTRTPLCVGLRPCTEPQLGLS